MKVLLWIGNEPNQRALANKIAASFKVAGIITETRKRVSKPDYLKLPLKIIERLLLGKIAAAWYGMLGYYTKRFPAYPSVPVLDVENINSEEAYDFTLQHQPDLVIVSGTRLIKTKLLSLRPSMGILNLHTGLSPYIKGGPNCTNWCIANNEFHLIGNTVMWLDAGIDTGNLVATEFTDFDGSESLLQVHIKVMEHAHDLYLRCIKSIAAGNMSNVPQAEIAKGKTFYSRQWNFRAKLQLVRNFRKFSSYFSSGMQQADREKITIISPEKMQERANG